MRGSATDPQRDYLRKLGVSDRQLAGISKADASAMIDELKTLRDAKRQSLWKWKLGGILLLMLLSYLAGKFY